MLQKVPNSCTVEMHTPHTVQQRPRRKRGGNFRAEKKAEIRPRKIADAARTTTSRVATNPQTDVLILAGAKFHPSPVTPLMPLAVLEPDCLVQSPTRDPRLIGYIPASPQPSQETRQPAEKKAARVGADKRRANEMAIACEVQRKLFPQRMPPLETLDYAGNCEQACTIGGDFFDFLDMGRGRVGLVVADVSGKGIFAALLMANLQASVRGQYVLAREDLTAFFRSVNKLFYESVSPGFFATMFFGDYSDATRKLRYVNCGHNPPFLVQSNGVCEKLGATATVLGVFDKWDCTVGEATMSSGDILVAYSDGVTEMQSESGELFGDERLLGAVRADASLPAAGLLTAIVAAAHNFSGKELEDDLTLLVARAC